MAVGWFLLNERRKGFLAADLNDYADFMSLAA